MTLSARATNWLELAFNLVLLFLLAMIPLGVWKLVELIGAML